MLLKGVIDCPDLPLNVSRSALQNDGFVKKISEYITKKVADKLIGMCKTEKDAYEKYWDDISPFIKFGCLKDDKFCEKMNDYILFKNLDDKYLTMGELIVKEEEKQEDSSEETAETTEEKEPKEQINYYVTDRMQQSQYINMFKEANMDAVILEHNIDQPFVQQLEAKNEGVRFLRSDSDVTENLKEEVSEEELKDITETLGETFKKALNNDKLEIKVEKLKNPSVSSMLTMSEESRRMQEMMKMYSMQGRGMDMFGGAGETLILNANNALVKYIVDNKESENVPMICEQLYALAVIANKPLAPEKMTEFIA